MHNYVYYVSMVDDFSRFTWLFPLKHKSNFFHIFVSFQKQVEKYLGKSITELQTDTGIKFLNTMMREYLQSQGIRHRYSYFYTPQQDGRVERRHRSIVEIARCVFA